MKKQIIIPLISGLLVVFASIGLTRMSFGMVLPLMQTGLDITATQIGFIGTANFIGYFIGVLFSSYFYNRFNTAILISLCLIFEAIVMTCMTVSTQYLWVATFYFGAGVFSAIAYISIMSYIANVISPSFKGRALGMIISGNSIAIVFSGFCVYLFSYLQYDFWQISWLSFVICIVLTAIIVLKLINNPHHTTTHNKRHNIKFIITTTGFWKMASIYMIFGLSYVIFITYFVSTIIDKWQVNVELSSQFWILLGFISLFSGPFFGFIADKFSVYYAFIWVYLLQSLANLLLFLDIETTVVLYVSAMFFGLSVWAVPSLITLLSANYFGSKNTSMPLSLVTLLFTFAQATAPISGGYIYDITRSYDFIFLISFLLTLCASILCLIYIKQKFITYL